MSDADLEALRGGYEAWNRGDLGAVLALVDPDIDWQPGDEAPESGGGRGRAGFEQFIASWTESFEDLQIEPLEFIEIGDHVVTVVHQKGRGRGSGVELEIDTVHVWTIRDGTAVAWTAYRNRDDAIAEVQRDVVRRGYEALNRGDVEAALEFLHPEIEWHTYIVPGPGGGVYRGHDGVRELWAEAKRIFGDFRNVPEEMFDGGDQVVTFVRVEGVGAMSGVAVQARIAHLMTFRGEKIVTVQSFEDRDDALRAAGLA
jgi:uncharacterized protein